MPERLYFRQLLAGRDFARDNPIARQMVNFVYAIGDRERGDAVLVDPAYGVAELVQLVDADGLKVTGALATYLRPDPGGGGLLAYERERVQDLLELARAVLVHAQGGGACGDHPVPGPSESDLLVHDS